MGFAGPELGSAKDWTVEGLKRDYRTYVDESGKRVLPGSPRGTVITVR
ncbi:MAG TPA: hypothetical protein P5125_03435 [Kiritimatiellia bacterium]|jgi:hypothetical protein|nr:hypothetical protein [Kiritimatiellia bacterium]HPW75638.1 hypothetical protein [Kiritimatiellia bacterium]HRU19387.1 hypothetical protein [Kiritimatiellia bacterium]